MTCDVIESVSFCLCEEGQRSNLPTPPHPTPLDSSLRWNLHVPRDTIKDESRYLLSRMLGGPRRDFHGNGRRGNLLQGHPLSFQISGSLPLPTEARNDH